MFHALNDVQVECNGFLTSPRTGGNPVAWHRSLQGVPGKAVLTNSPVVGDFWGGLAQDVHSQGTSSPRNGQTIHVRDNALCGTTPGQAGYPPLPALARARILDWAR